MAGKQRIIEYNGQARSISEWADVMGVKPQTLVSRLRLGWPVERVLSLPVNGNMARASRSYRSPMLVHRLAQVSLRSGPPVA
jgi:hypothetical protein